MKIVTMMMAMPLALSLSVVSAQAQVSQTISFSGLVTQSNGTLVTSYSEDGYTITAPSSPRSLTVQGTFGAAPEGIPSVNFLRNGSFSLTGGTFTFGGFDGYFTGTGTTLRPITVTGYLAGTPTYTETFARATPSFFENFSSQSGARVFDRLFFTTGNETGQVLLDNIAVTSAIAAAPEPATWGLMILGFGLVGAALRRRGVAPAARPTRSYRV